MMRLVNPCVLATLASCLLACSDEAKLATIDAPSDVPDTGFKRPTMAVHANDETGPGMWMDLGPADLSCLDTPTTDMATTVEVTLNTEVLDFQSEKMVDGAVVTVFSNAEIGASFATGTSNAEGLVSLTIPPGKNRIGFKMSGGMSGTNTQLDTFLLNQHLEPGVAVQTSPELLSVSDSTAQLLPALIGENRISGSGVLAGALRDCADHEVSNFIATVSSTKGTATLLEGASTYYFSSTSSPLPQKHNVFEMASSNGLYMVIQLPATPTAYVQMWGYKNDADLTADTLSLIAELEVPVISDSVVTGSYQPKRTP